MNTRLKGRDYIDLRNYSKEDFELILDLSFELKRKQLTGEPHRLCEGKELGMLFCNPSTRTRVTFETAMSHLGGHAQYYESHHLQLAKESWVDTAHVMDRYLDGLVVRMENPQTPELPYGGYRNILLTLAENAKMPILSAIDDKEHPTLPPSDIMTMIEKFGPDYKKRKVALIWVCNRRPLSVGIPHSMAITGMTLGMNLTYAYPEGYDIDKEYFDDAMKCPKKSGGRLEIVHSIEEAVKDASVIYAKGWQALGKTIAEDAKMRESLLDWRIRLEHFKHAAPDCIFMTPMPVERVREADPEVVDGPMSVIYDEAENLLHTKKAILSLILG
jgi:ornithine carbamoyltransferase